MNEVHDLTTQIAGLELTIADQKAEIQRLRSELADTRAEMEAVRRSNKAVIESNDAVLLAAAHPNYGSLGGTYGGDEMHAEGTVTTTTSTG